MPTYDYECSACERVFEHFQSMKSKVLRKCPYCEKRKLKRLIGRGGGIIFKGDGFYCNDYNDEKSKKKKSEEKKSEKNNEPKSD